MLEPSPLELLFEGPFGLVAAFLWGALWGSFFNVLVVRVPAGESLLRPASHCRGCRRAIAGYDNIPIASYLLLRGRCRHCGERFSARYLLVEALVAMLAVLAYQVLVVQAAAPLGLRLAQFVISSLFIGLLVAIAFIDIATMRIPNAITYPAIPAAVALSLLMGHPHLWDGLVGAAAGYLVIRLIADGYQLLTGRLGMGYGDAKLLALVGGLLGWQALLPTLFLASLQGSVIGITVLALQRRRQRRGAPASRPELAAASASGGQPRAESASEDAAKAPAPGQPERSDQPQEPEDLGAFDEPEEPAEGAPLRHARLPFGPFLSLAALEVLLLRPGLADLVPFLLD